MPFRREYSSLFIFFCCSFSGAAFEICLLLPITLYINIPLSPLICARCSNVQYVFFFLSSLFPSRSSSGLRFAPVSSGSLTPKTYVFTRTDRTAHRRIIMRYHNNNTSACKYANEWFALASIFYCGYPGALFINTNMINYLQLH